MKFRVISDLHVEFYAHPQYLQKKLNKLYPIIAPDEILIIAGDLGVAGTGTTKLSMNEEYRSMLEYFSKRWNTVILVPGNHEYYDRDKYCKLDHIDAMIEFECKKLGIVFLNKNAIKIKESKGSRTSSKSKGSERSSDLELRSERSSIYILGCTLWSEATPQAYKGMNDKLKAILSHKELISTHNEHKEWLEYSIHNIQRKDKHAKILIITHHLPLYELTHPKYLTPKYKPLNSAYASDLSLLMDSTNLNIHKEDSHNSICFWCCGHTHEMTKAVHKGINFFINPMGYPRESRVTKTQNEIIEL